jgi:hypothetical protein
METTPMTPEPDHGARQPIEDDTALDGNAAAGLLQAAFGGDVTATVMKCATCATESAGGALRAYFGGPGVVLRCPACSSVVLRVAVRGDRLALDLAGIAPGTDQAS